MSAYRKVVRVLSFTSLLMVGTLGYSCATKSEADTEKAAALKPATKPTAVAAKPQVLPTPPKIAPVAAGSVATEDKPRRLKRAPKQQESQAQQSERVTRYVAAGVLNVRAKPNTAAAVVGRLTKGSQLPVEIKGEWAKIGDDQYVQTKFLTAQGKAVAASK